MDTPARLMFNSLARMFEFWRRTMSKKPRQSRTRSPYEKLEEATKTLEKERKFFDALMAAGPVAEVVNRIIHLVTFFQGAEKYIPPYLERNAARLFPTDSIQVASTLYALLTEITRSARLAGYLCVKDIPEQALAVLRGTIEQTGVYTTFGTSRTSIDAYPILTVTNTRKHFAATAR
jgi:hypothetical protein